jgi:hypothetical protein
MGSRAMESNMNDGKIDGYPNNVPRRCWRTIGRRVRGKLIRLVEWAAVLRFPSTVLGCPEYDEKIVSK